MSFFRIGKNELKSLVDEKKHILNELETSKRTDDIYDFRALQLKKKLQQLETKIFVLSRNDPNSPNTAC